MKIEAFLRTSYELRDGGHAAYGYVLLAGSQPFQVQGYVGVVPAGSSLGFAEFMGLLAVLEKLQARGLQDEPITIFSDSRFLV